MLRKQQIAKEFPGIIKESVKQKIIQLYLNFRKIPLIIEEQAKLKKLWEQGRVEKLDLCSDINIILPLVIVVKKDVSIDLAPVSEVLKNV